MTRLDCTVTGCMYNKEKCCCKDNIQVEGDHAKHSRDTCCSSFREQKEGMSNCVNYPTKDTDVACKATDCTFNENCHCQAKHIGIAGGNACECQETECATFRCKCD
jgi:hypothetical protein